MRTSRFHFVDLAIVFAVTAVAFTLVMPALARARTAARAASCSDNFKMIGLAMHNYHDVYNLFPPGRILADPKSFAKDPKNSGIDRGVGLAILPFLEEVALYNSFNFSVSWHAVANRTACAKRVAAYLCPEDAGTTSTATIAPPGQATNITYPLGSTAWVTQPESKRGPKPEGLFFDNSVIGVRSITDGTSNTVMASEQLIDQVRRGGPGESGDCAGNVVDAKTFADRTGTRWVTGHPSSNYFNGRRTPNHAEPDCFDGVSPTGVGSLNKVPRSRHDGGVHVLRADGSVAFARNGIDLGVWQALLTRSGHEVIDSAALTPIPARPAPVARSIPARPAEADPRVVLSVDFESLQQTATAGFVTNVAKDGKVRLAVMEESSGHSLSEGLYVGLVIPPDHRNAESPAGMKVMRATVTEIGERNSVTLEVAPSAAAQVKNGLLVALVRPPGSTTAQLREVPDLVGVDGAGQSPNLVPARNNLKQIGLALHNFHGTHGCFPPAVVFGPDGKPWHSWRVLILPYLEQQPLYKQYDFAEPWDSPKNRKVLEKMPAVYRDPVHGDAASHFTHFAAITGPGTAFPAEGVAMKEMKLPEIGGPGTTRIRNVRDGTSLTIFAGSVSPERKIPWTKPEDVVFGPTFKKLGHAESFAAPHLGAGLILMGDATVRAIRNEISTKLLSALTTIDGGEIVDDAEIPTVETQSGQPRGLQLIRTPDGVKLRLVN